MHRAASKRLGIVSTYLPRRCGLATYTADLREALGVAAGDIDPVIVAIDRDGHSYSDDVVAIIDQDRIADYEHAAERIVAAGVDIVLIQHEYGIFGGPNGSYVLHLARALTKRRIPYLVTLHTLLSQPSAGQSATLSALCATAARVTVFTETARRMAIRNGVASGQQITVVPHGAPEILRTAAPVDDLRPAVTELLDLVGDDPVLTTFGLVSAGKGLEDALGALGDVVREHPRTRYVIAGATHPEIVRTEGESYRESLHSQVRRSGLSANVHFIDSFLTPAELSALLARTTIFVTPYRSADQTCSGALTFAVAAGCPVVSTAYRYAEDLLAEGAGALVPCGDVSGLAAALTGLLDAPDRLAEAKAAAHARGAGLVWPAVALTTANLIRAVLDDARTGIGGPLPLPVVPVPPLKLAHLAKLTDEIGIIEFCRGAEPDLRYGYNVDDVSRLAIVAAQLLDLGRPSTAELAQRWVRLGVRFLVAAHASDGRMHNRMSYAGSWTDQPHPGDHVGRAIWALGAVARHPAIDRGLRQEAAVLLDALAPHARGLADLGLRSIAYALLGLVRADGAATDGAAARAAEMAALVGLLDAALHENAVPGWYWFEPVLTYDNARLPQALLAGATALGDREAAGRARTALDWYADQVGLTAGMLRNVGNHWRHRDTTAPHKGGEARDDGDEQPIDAASAVEAMVEAWRCTGDARYGTLAEVAYAWYHGRNRAGAALYDESSGGCHDGLTRTGVNPNCGAESTLAHQQALLSLLTAGLAATPRRATADPSANWRGALVKLDRKVTLRGADHTKPASSRRRRTTEGQHDGR
jgi:glycosyltransferase involved in cell wall biosynthesis